MSDQIRAQGHTKVMPLRTVRMSPYLLWYSGLITHHYKYNRYTVFSIQIENWILLEREYLQL